MNRTLTVFAMMVLAAACLFAGPAQAQLNATLTSMSFSPAAIVSGGESTLSITITNAANATINGATFTYTPPAGMMVNGPGSPLFIGGCLGGSDVQTNGSTYSANLNIAANSSCTVTALVTASGPGLYVNGASTIAGWNGNPLAFAASTFAAGDELTYQGLWWVTGGAESGWGIDLAHQGDQIFATWFTYDTTGKTWWLSMLATRTTPTGTTYTGTIYVDSGPPFNNYVGAGAPNAVGSGTLTFADLSNGNFAYSVNGVRQSKAITRFDLGTGPQVTCVYTAAMPNLAATTNYQDLWWVPNGAESGWGVSFAHQGDSIFATWYTYNILGGTPLWLSALAARQGTGNVYTGPIYQNSGPRFDAYDATNVVANPVGTATFTFADGNDAAFEYKVMVAPLPGPVTQSKQLTRFPFAATGGTVCQ